MPKSSDYSNVIFCLSWCCWVFLRTTPGMSSSPCSSFGCNPFLWYGGVKVMGERKCFIIFKFNVTLLVVLCSRTVIFKNFCQLSLLSLGQPYSLKKALPLWLWEKSLVKYFFLENGSFYGECCGAHSQGFSFPSSCQSSRGWLFIVLGRVSCNKGHKSVESH